MQAALPYISRIVNDFVYKNHVVIVTELLGKTLLDRLIITNYVGVSLAEIKIIMRTLFTFVDNAAKLGVIHADLKPENVCYTLDRSQLKVIDFGSAQSIANPRSLYIESRYYRAPEIILRLPFDDKIDVWATACIGMEMFLGLPIFPGQLECHMLVLFEKYLGPMPQELALRSPRREEFFDEDGNLKDLDTMLRERDVVLENRQFYIVRENLQDTVWHYRRTLTRGTTNYRQRELFLDLIENCFQYDPADRITAEDALKHPFFTETVNRNRSK